jgi:DNA polymerase alpha subunit B
LQVKDYSVFPGQVIAVEGIVTQTRGAEKTIKASAVYEGCPLPLADRATAPGPGVHAMVAAGPYTTKDSMEYVPLAELLDAAADEQPDLLVLCGPFVDSKHPVIAASKLVHKTYEEVFFETVLSKVNTFVRVKSPGTRVVMVPSERDVHTDYVFPQPPMEMPRDEHGSALYEMHGNISFARNPSTIRCKGVDFGVVSADVMKFMNMVTLSNVASTKEPGKRMASRVEQCLRQRHFMPCFPLPSAAVASFPLDLSRLRWAADSSCV